MDIIQQRIQQLSGQSNQKLSPVEQLLQNSGQGKMLNNVSTEKQSILDKLGSRGQSFLGRFTPENVAKQTFGESILQATGDVAGGVMDIAGSALSAGGRVLSAITPDVIEKPIKQVGIDILQSPIGQAGLNAIKGGLEKWNEFKTKNPRAGADIEAVVNIASVLPIEKVVGLGVKGAKQLAKPAVAGLEKSLSRQLVDEAIQITKPKLSTAEKESALMTGRAKQKFGQITIQPSELDKQVGSAVADVVSNRKNPIQNIDAINAKIAKVAQETEAGLALDKTGFNTNQLKSYLNGLKEESRVVFGTEKSLENSYDSVINEFVRIQKNHPQNIGGALAARKEFDVVMKKKFPNLFKNPMSDITKYNAILDVRRGVNDFIESRLPEGNIFKDQLKQQTLMFKAQKNVAQNAVASVDKHVMDRVMSLLRKNPLISVYTGGILTFGALTGMLTNPFIIGSLVAGGSIKLGAEVITSKTLKQILIKLLKTEGTTIEEKGAVNILIKQIDEGGGNVPVQLPKDSGRK
jgi:hypothetical protein